MKKYNLIELTEIILNEMSSAGFTEKTRRFYLTLFRKLQHIAQERRMEYYSEELGRLFMEDDSHIKPENSVRYHHERTRDYVRCINLIESYLRDGVVDWSPKLSTREYPIKSETLKICFNAYIKELEKRQLRPNTIDGYRRFTYYFIEFIESKGYVYLSDILPGDVVAFITIVSTERYQPTSLGGHLPGLRIFLNMHNDTKIFIRELPCHLPKKREILQVYSDEEYIQIITYLNTVDTISFRNKAITIIALETGMRAIDICNLKLSNIKWEQDYIHIIQQKTGRSHNIPLSESMGNALVDYLLNERPISSSEFVFLHNHAPFTPIISHSGIRNILFHIVNDVDIKSNGRIYGSRITRHSAASRMLRNGIPLPMISEALGHGNSNSVMIYITTDDQKLAECTLPLPKRRRIQ